MAEATIEDLTASTSIADLPDNLLLHILSLLPSTLDAAQTSLVCRKWRNLVHSLPSLHFSQTLFPPSSSPPETLRCFTDFINRTLILRSRGTPILRFRLQFPVIDLQYVSHINSWIRHAVNNGVLHLDIDLLKPWDFGDFRILISSDGTVLRYYEFPFPILRNSSVRVLKLCFCKIWLPANSRFDSLRSVTLDRVFLTDQMVSDLMLACVSLEELVLDCVWGIKNVKICSSTLRKLSLERFFWEELEGSLEVVAPNLVWIMVLLFHVSNYDFKEMVSLEEVKLVVQFNDHWCTLVRSLGNVKHLYVYNFWFEFLASKDVPSEGFVLNNLNLLEMHTGYEKSELLGIAGICECSQNLETLIINGVQNLLQEEGSISEEDMKSISFNLPRLKQVKVNEFRGTNNELLFVTRLGEQGAVLEKIELVPANWGKVSLDGLKELKISKDILLVQKLKKPELH